MTTRYEELSRILLRDFERTPWLPCREYHRLAARTRADAAAHESSIVDGFERALDCRGESNETLAAIRILMDVGITLSTEATDRMVSRAEREWPLGSLSMMYASRELRHLAEAVGTLLPRLSKSATGAVIGWYSHFRGPGPRFRDQMFVAVPLLGEYLPSEWEEQVLNLFSAAFTEFAGPRFGEVTLDIALDYLTGILAMRASPRLRQATKLSDAVTLLLGTCVEACADPRHHSHRILDIYQLAEWCRLVGEYLPRSAERDAIGRVASWRLDLGEAVTSLEGAVESEFMLPILEPECLAVARAACEFKSGSDPRTAALLARAVIAVPEARVRYLAASALA